MSNTRTARRRLALAAIPVAGLVGLLGSACSSTDDASSVSASGTRVSVPTQVETSIAPTTTALTTLPQAPTSAAPAPSSGGGSPATTTSGGGSPAPSTTAPAPSTLPVVTSIHGPATADCEAGFTGTVTITVNYTAANATYVEYLGPSSDRPGADAATGSVLFNYDCTQPSQVFKIRAFNEFNGSDAKDPSPYVSVTVARRIIGGADSSPTTAP